MQSVVEKDRQSRRSASVGQSRPASVPGPVPAIHSDVTSAYATSRRVLYALAVIIGAVFIAGFWNYHLVDGFGRDVVAGKMIGDTSELAGGYVQYGTGFGFLFAIVAGLAATFTACNCVVFAMIPGLACSSDHPGEPARPWRALATFVAGVTIVCLVYGGYVGLLGADGVEAYNAREVRLAQAQLVFSTIGLVMLVWGLIEMGFLDRITTRLSPAVRSRLSSATTKAAIIGLLVGFFAIGRPFPVFREFLTYAASAQNPIYGAAVMAVQGIGQIIVMVLVFALLFALAGRRIMRWASEHPHKPQLVSGLALLGGGAFFVYYWGLAFLFDIGQWGMKLGWYG